MVVVHDLKRSARTINFDYSARFGKLWAKSLTDLINSDYMTSLQYYIDELYNLDPPEKPFPRFKYDVFKAFKLCRFEDLKVVIFGNEPDPRIYSNGLAFGEYNRPHDIYSKRLTTVKANIDNTLYDGRNTIFDPSLESWAEQGVLLLNTSLISQTGKSGEHQIIFRNFIREVVETISIELCDVVFVFTDKKQHYFQKFIDKQHHHIIEVDGLDGNAELFDEINRLLITSDGTGAEITW